MILLMICFIKNCTLIKKKFDSWIISTINSTENNIERILMKPLYKSYIIPRSYMYNLITLWSIGFKITSLSLLISVTGPEHVIKLLNGRSQNIEFGSDL